MKHCYVENCRFNHTHVTAGHQCGTCGQLGHGQIECGDTLKITQLSSDHINDLLPVDLQCTVFNCQQKQFHTADAHYCDSCSKFGHGKDTCPENIIKIKCPICRNINDIPANQQTIYNSNTKCVICFQDGAANVFFPQCGHLCVCKQCCLGLDLNNAVSSTVSAVADDDLELLSETAPIYQQAVDSLGDHPGRIYTIMPAGMGCQFYFRRDSPQSNLEYFFMHSDDWGQYGPTADRRMHLYHFLQGYSVVPS